MTEWSLARCLFPTIAAVLCLGAGPVRAEQREVLSTAEALALPRPEADRIIPYGDNPLQFGELRLPETEGPHPVAVLVHGGCWLSAYDLGYFAGLAEALAEEGIATWSIEYRRVGDEGGGWPGTFADVAAGADFLHRIASEHRLDLDRVVVVGHSAGGHLALWLAGRHGLDVEDPLRGEGPLKLSGVVALAGIPDLEAYASPEGCGAAVEGLLGGEPAAVQDRLARSSPVRMVPLGVPQRLVAGSEDTIVPLQLIRDYQSEARSRGDDARVLLVEGAGHFELSTPHSVAWPAVRESVLGLLQAD